MSAGRSIVSVSARLVAASVVLVAVMAAVGCSDGRSEVFGRVTRAGKPIELADCRITFVNEDKGVFAVGKLDAEGKYKIHTHNTSGLEPGAYAVVVSFPAEYLPPTKSPTEPFPPDELEKRLGRFIPKRYRDPKTSGLTLEVKDEDIEFNVDMTD